MAASAYLTVLISVCSFVDDVDESFSSCFHVAKRGALMLPERSSTRTISVGLATISERQSEKELLSENRRSLSDRC